MQRQTLLTISTLWLVGLTLTPAIAQAAGKDLVGATPVSHPSSGRLIAQANNQELSRLLKEGRKLVDSGNFTGALALYQQAASLDSKNAKIFSGIGYLQARQGEFQAAADAYRQAVALDPKMLTFSTP